MKQKFRQVPVTRSVRDGILAAADHLAIMVEFQAKLGREDRGMENAIEIMREMIDWENLYIREAKS